MECIGDRSTFLNGSRDVIDLLEFLAGDLFVVRHRDADIDAAGLAFDDEA